MPSTLAELPYISVIATAPDGAASDQFTARWNALAAQYGLSCEVLVVPTGRRNAAIRQARGEFILSTRADAEFSPDLFQFLATRSLDEARLYRLDCREGDCLHAREGTFRVTSPGGRENPPGDITPANSGVHFGEGFFPLEGGARWLATPAEIQLTSHPPDAALELDIEPGSGLGPLPQPLQLLDETGATVAEFSIAGRTTVRFWPPLSTKLLRLTTRDGGRALLDDLRILDFRCFRCAWVPPAGESAPSRTVEEMRPTLLRLTTGGAPHRIPNAIHLLRQTGADIFGPAIAYAGDGWHRLEDSGTERFRWVSTAAELIVQTPQAQQDLCLLVEPGPSLQSQPFQLIVRFADGAEIARVKIAGVTPLRIPLPIAPHTTAKLLLSPDRQGDALPGDSRVLNFRVLACACEASRKPAPPVAPFTRWTAVTVAGSPVAIEWPANAQRNEIGKPAFLHTNGCDFVLMSRERWLDLRGYPEIDEPDDYRDALLCYSAHFAGAQEEVLRAPIRMTRPPDSRTISALDEDLVWLITQMRRLRAPVILNTESWGRDA